MWTLSHLNKKSFPTLKNILISSALSLSTDDLVAGLGGAVE